MIELSGMPLCVAMFGQSFSYSVLGIQSVVKGVILFATDGRLLTHYTYYHFFEVCTTCRLVVTC